jgi:large subunit ribosomal protein L28
MMHRLFRLKGSLIMSRVCDVCGKGAMTGNRIIRHGLAKKKGGIGLHTTGVTRRKFMPNLQSVRTVKNGTVRKQQVCMSCLKKGEISKA